MGKQKEKGPPPTKEELKERRRARRLLIKQRKEERLRQIKRDYLARELKYCRLNREKYEKGWKKTLLDLKMRDLHISYQYHVNYSERILDAKDMEISLLLDALDVAEQQYEFNLQKYILNFDTIVDALDQSLNDLKNEYDEELAELLDLSEAERNQQKKTADERSMDLKLVLFGLEKNRQIKTNEDKSRYLSRIKEEEDMTMAEIELKQAALELKFEHLWRAYKETIHEYKRENDETKKEFDVLYSQDTFMRKWIKEQTRQLFRAYDKIYQLKFEQSQEKDAIDLQLKSKIEEHQFFLNGFHSLKQQLKDDVDRDNEQSKNVVKYCNESIHKLESLRYKGEYILKMNGICRKFETEKELIMPYPEFCPNDISSQHLMAKLAAATDHIKLYKEKKIMELFMQRCSQGDALRNVLYEELDYFTKENERIKKELYSHCKSREYSCINVAKKADHQDQEKEKKSKVKYLCVKNFPVDKN